MVKSAQKVDVLKKKMDALASVKIPTQEYKEISKQIADAEKKQAALNDRMSKFLELGGDTKSKQFRSMQYDAAELENTIAYAKGELQDLVDTGKAFTLGNATADFNNLNQKLNEEQAKLNELSRQYSAAQSSLGDAGSIASVSKGFSKISGAAKKAFGIIQKGAVASWGGIKKLGSGISNIAKKAVSAIAGIGEGSKSSGRSVRGLGRRILELAKSAFIFNVLSNGFRQLTAGIGSAFQTYQNYDVSLKNSINGLRSQLAALQGSLVSAFAPIISVIVPYLSTLISWVTTAANAVAAFIAALMGKTSYKKAVANVGAVGAAADDAAGSLNDATEAAEELEKALGHYDELNVIDQPTSSGNSGSGESGGGGGGGSAGDITYEDVEISSAISDFAEKVKEAWSNSDFTEVGGIIGQKLEDALNSIPWNGIQATAQKIGKSVATLINGFVETSGLGDMVGKTVAEGINTGLLGVESFTGNLHFDSIGQFVADGINGSLNNLKWDSLSNVAENIGGGLAEALNEIMTVETFSNVGKSFAKTVNSVFTGAHKFVSSSNWSGWGSAIASSINNYFSTFDWGDAGLTFNKAANGILDTMLAALKETNWDIVGRNIAEFIKKIDFKQLLSKVGDVIWEAIKAAIELWKDSFDAAPVETVIVTALLALKFIGLGTTLGTILWGAIKNSIMADTVTATATTTLSSAIGGVIAGALPAILTSAVFLAGLATLGVGFYAAISDALEQEYNDSVSDFLNSHPGAMAPDGETPEIEFEADVKINPKKVEVTPQTMIGIGTDNLSVEAKNINLPSETAPIELPVELIVLQKGADATWEEKIRVIAEVTGVDYSKLPVSNKKINDTYAEITNAYLKTGYMPYVSSVANLNSTKDNIPSKNKTVNGYTAGMKYWTKYFSPGMINGFTAGMKKSKISFKPGSISGFTAKATKFKDGIPSWKKIISGFIGTLTRYKADGGVYQNGTWSSLPQKAMGGILQSNFWQDIPKYATGGSPHGTMFVAGEAGPEVVGHVGGRTEVLNKSQIASAIASAISSVMNTALNDVAKAMLSHMTECTNMVITNMGSIMDAIYSASSIPEIQPVQFAGLPNGYMPDTNRVNAVYSAGSSGGMQIDYDKLASTVANRISGSIEIPINMALDGNVVYRDMVRIDRATMKQTGKSGFGGN